MTWGDLMLDIARENWPVAAYIAAVYFGLHASIRFSKIGPLREKGRAHALLSVFFLAVVAMGVWIGTLGLMWSWAYFGFAAIYAYTAHTTFRTARSCWVSEKQLLADAAAIEADTERNPLVNQLLLHQNQQMRLGQTLNPPTEDMWDMIRTIGYYDAKKAARDAEIEEDRRFATSIGLEYPF